MPLADPDLPRGIMVPVPSPAAPAGTDPGMYERVRIAFERQPRRSRLIFVWRHGLFGQERRTLAAVGEILGVGKERVRQLLNATEAAVARELFGTRSVRREDCERAVDHLQALMRGAGETDATV